jgi:hypothetical protein
VKDGSGALYDFAGQGQNHKSESEQPDPAARRNDEASGRDTPKHTKHLDFQPHNPLKFKREGSRVKNLDGLQKFINFAL